MKSYFLWLAKLLTLLIIFIVVIPLLIAGAVVATGKTLDGGEDGTNKNAVAVIELQGTIEGSKQVVKDLYKQAKNKDVKGIVLRIDSPGGAVGPSQDIYEAVKRLKTKEKPIVVSMGSVAASGGLYSALSASKVFCEPGTLTGSIGVIMQVPNFKKIADWAGFQMITIKSGKLKDVGNPFRDMTPEETAFLEATIQQVREQFVTAVVEGRKLKREDVDRFADGRVIVGSEAKKLGLVDDFGSVYDAARAVFELRGEPLKDGEVPSLYYPEDKFGHFKKFLSTFSSIPALWSRGAELRFEM